jgi:hypothetical protein
MSEARSEIHVRAQQSSRLDTGGLLTIRPDLEFVRGKTVVGVADVKYKLLDDHGKFPNPTPISSSPIAQAWDSTLVT